jgi:hypothetical protein
MRIFLAGLAGAITMFVWTSVAHMATPLASTGISQMDNEGALGTALQTATGNKAGFYIFPGADMKDPNAMAKADAAMKIHPSGLLIYHPPGATGITPVRLVAEFLTEFAEALIAAFLLAQTMLAAYAARAGFVTLLGVGAALTTNVSYWNWYGFPVSYTIAYASIEIIGYLVAGLVIAAILKPRTA